MAAWTTVQVVGALQRVMAGKQEAWRARHLLPQGSIQRHDDSIHGRNGAAPLNAMDQPHSLIVKGKSGHIGLKEIRKERRNGK